MKKNLQKLTGVLLALVMVLSLAACAPVVDNKDDAPAVPVADGATIGEGGKTFQMEVTDADGKVVKFTVKSDEKTVGAALLALGIIAGEDSQYGLYVKSVNGITADYDKDQTWWGFYIDGVSANAGVDSTDIVSGSTYGFKVEK